MRIKIRQLKYPASGVPSLLGQEVTIKGWVRTVRNQKTFSFVEVNDGSTLSNFQVILNPDLPDYEKILGHLSTGVSVAVTGKIVENPGKDQAWEMQAKSLTIIGACDPETYPLQKKRHSFEFLRSIAHLRPRTNTLGAITRLRNSLAFATHLFYQQKGFLYLHTPIITASDCEGAGKMFRVTTMEPSAHPRLPNGQIDYSQDFFGKPAYLTVSGQLNGEIYACALSDVYTFGPTFRAENSNTSRHLAEFWMIEPEMAFADINDNMDNAEEYLKFVLKYALDNCAEDMEFFDKHVSTGLIERMQHVINTPFERATYSYAVRILEKSGKNFEYPVKWGLDLQSEHERYLAEEFFAKPVILTDYPKQIKAFYMRDNSDNKTVAAMDVLVPKIGEIIGGSQREERLDVLEHKLKAGGLSPDDYWWYLELRKYGTVPHAGYGVGFERLIQFVSGMDNIRDVIPFPRYPGKAEF
ncbi:MULTISPECIES: asparagine--tRNA ligase [unclassified Neochlamydia]|uniref:asparagine--tRNA ligase n=1 Tax=unclassified Neochlamydia TaxID=2643326 RepID=UPI0014088471|nr:MULTISPECIES: asparagine--tRNA ligase [unclassified Neochlamydia]